MKNLLVVMGLSLLLAAGTSFAQNKIYKTKDKDGNTIYTDQPPPEGAVPMDLPELSIVKPRENQQSVRQLNVNRRGDPTGGAPALPSQAEMRQTYAGMEISSPVQDETIWGGGGSVDVNVDLKGPLLPGLLVQVIYDGRVLPAQAATSVRLEEVDRGEHTVQAAIVDSTGQAVAKTDPVKFFVQQHSVNFNRRGN